MAKQRLSRKSQNPQELLRKALRFETSLRETLEENPFLFEEEYEVPPVAANPVRAGQAQDFFASLDLARRMA